MNIDPLSIVHIAEYLHYYDLLSFAEVCKEIREELLKSNVYSMYSQTLVKCCGGYYVALRRSEYYVLGNMRLKNGEKRIICTPDDGIMKMYIIDCPYLLLCELPLLGTPYTLVDPAIKNKYSFWYEKASNNGRKVPISRGVFHVDIIDVNLLRPSNKN